jgi:hypothetical protein
MHTRYKSKLSRHLSYPVGLELLSEQLAGVPQEEQMLVCFSAVSPLKSQSKMEGRHRILDCRYVIRDEHPWQIYVTPVTREFGAKIRALLLERAIPKMRGWLEKERSEFWLSDSHGLSVFFDASSGELECVEPY